VVIVTHYLRV